MKDYKMNIQLFAEFDPVNPTTPGPTGYTNLRTTTNQDTVVGGLSIEMKEFYSKSLLEMVSPNLVHAQFGEKVTIPKNSGRTIEWRMFSSFKPLDPVTGKLEEGVTPDATALQVTRVTAELGQYGAWSWVSDLLDLEAIDNVIVEYTKKHAENGSKTLDGVVKAALKAGCKNYTVAGGNTTAATLQTPDKPVTVNDIKRVVTYLKNNDAPTIDGSYVAIVHPSVAYDIMKDEQWIDVSEYAGGTQIFNGELGKLYGVRFVETTTAYKDGSTYVTFFIGKDAYKVVSLDGNNMEVIVKTPNSNSTNDPLNQRSTVGFKCNGYTAQVTIPAYLYALVSTSSLDATDDSDDP